MGLAINTILKKNPKRAVLVVITDGMENSSKEETKTSISAKIKQMEDKGYEVVFIGASFENMSDARDVGLVRTKLGSLKKGNYDEGMRQLASSRNSYSTEGRAIDISNNDSTKLS